MPPVFRNQLVSLVQVVRHFADQHRIGLGEAMEHLLNEIARTWHPLYLADGSTLPESVDDIEECHDAWLELFNRHWYSRARPDEPFEIIVKRRRVDGADVCALLTQVRQTFPELEALQSISQRSAHGEVPRVASTAGVLLQKVNALANGNERLKLALQHCVAAVDDRLYGFVARFAIDSMALTESDRNSGDYMSIYQWALRTDLRRDLETCWSVHQRNDARARNFFVMLGEQVQVELIRPIQDFQYGLPLYRRVGESHFPIDETDVDLAYVLRQLREGGGPECYAECPSWAEMLCVSRTVYRDFDLLRSPPEEAKDAGKTFRDAFNLLLARRYLSVADASSNAPSPALAKPATSVPLSKREESTYLNIIGALLEILTGGCPGVAKHQSIKNEAALIDLIADKYDGFDGLSKSTLQRKFPQSKRSISGGSAG